MIPTWDGSPANWARFADDVRSWKPTVDPDAKYSVAARLVSLGSPTARSAPASNSPMTT